MGFACYYYQRKVESTFVFLRNTAIRPQTGFALLLMLLLPTIPCLAQDERPAPVSTPKLAAANVLIGALSGGIVNASSRRSFWTGFVKGAGGGAVMFAGKRIIAQEGPLASWAGRQVAAIGSSQVRNAGAGRPLLEELILPLGPARVYVNTTGRKPVTAKLDITAVIGTIVMAQRPGASFDPAASFTNGAIIFTAPTLADNSVGALRLGVIRVFDIPVFSGDGRVSKSSVIAHELIHASQYDFINIAASNPVEGWALGKSRAGKLLHRYVDFSSASYVWTGLNGLLNPDERPWEREATALAPGY